MKDNVSIAWEITEALVGVFKGLACFIQESREQAQKIFQGVGSSRQNIILEQGAEKNVKKEQKAKFTGEL